MPLIVALQDEDREQRASLECDCGSPKGVGAECCEACARLDGLPHGSRSDGNPRTDKGTTAQIVALLRVEGFSGLTLKEIAEKIGSSRRNVLRRLHEMERGGRVRSWEEPGGNTSGSSWFGHERKRDRVTDDYQVHTKKYRLTAG